jgi:hypothetical protein
MIKVNCVQFDVLISGQRDIQQKVSSQCFGLQSFEMSGSFIALSLIFLFA